MTYSKKLKAKLREKYGPAALITGASSGIGRELAIQVAEAGLNLIIVARREQKLEDLKAELADRSVDIQIVVADVGTREGIEAIRSASEGVDVGLAIMSAGFGTSGSFLDNEMEAERSVVEVNCRALMELTHIFGNRMRARGKGGIVLLSSLVAFQGLPNASNYGASKAYVQSLAEGLYHEFQSHHIDILAAAPGPINSGFADVADMRMGNVADADSVAVPILKALGHRMTTLPGIRTKFLRLMLRTVPRSIKIRIMKGVMAGFTRHQ